MSSPNVEILRNWIDAFNRGDFDALFDEAHPAIEVHEWPAAPGAQVYHGRDGAREALDKWFDVWEWMRIEIEDVVEIEDRILVTFHQRARAKSSEIEVEITSFNVYTFSDSEIRRIELFTEREPALEAAGLTEDAVVAAKVRDGYEAFNRGDYEAFAEILDPDVRWDHSPVSGAPEEGVYNGRDEVLRLMERLRDAWEEQTFVLEDVAPTGPGEYVVRGVVRATGKTSGLALESRVEYAMKLRDGKATRVRFTLTGPAPRPDSDHGLQESVSDVVRAIDGAIASGDMQAVRERLHQDVVWEHNIGGGSPEEGVYRGRDSVIALFERLVEPWESLRFDGREINELEAGVAQVEGELHFKHRASAAEVIEPYAQRLEIRGRLLVRGEMSFGDRARESEHQLAVREERGR